MNEIVRMAATQVRGEMSETINVVAFGGKRIVLHRHGKDVAAVVSLDDLEILDKLDKDQELTSALNALIEAREQGTVSWEKVWKDLGLGPNNDVHGSFLARSKSSDPSSK
jgi:PHD/YefM family antitoxin component YafN of YafNO toxin-antitoxin module